MRSKLGGACVAAMAFLAMGCATTGSLGEYHFLGRALACHMRTPPEPQVFASYDARIDFSDPVGSVLRVGTSLVKAAGARQAAERMQRALDAVDVPEEIRRSTLEEFADVLGCDAQAWAEDADYLLELEIQEYGIEARSWSSEAQFRIDLRVTLRDGYEGREIWSTRVHESAAITPAIFGLPGAAGNVMSAITLSELSEEDIGRGLMRLAEGVAVRVGDRLSRALRYAREG
jgi:hypothetical protein